MRKFCCVAMAAIVCGLLALPFAALAVEVPGVSPLEFAAPAVVTMSPEAHWIWSVLANESVHNFLWWVLGSIVTVVMGVLKWRETKKERAIRCLLQSVKEIGDRWVRRIKTDIDHGGKLTEEQRRQANQEAIALAYDLAKAQGINLFKLFAKETLPAVVDSLVRRLKKESALAKLPLPPQWPDLAPSTASGL